VAILFVALTVAIRCPCSDKDAMRNLFLAAAILPLLSGCIVGTVAKTAVDVATVPVKVASAGVNAVLPNRKKEDEKRGKELRKQDEQRGREARAMAERCDKGQALPTDVCTQATPR
jgi:hypothetical protein